MPIFPLRLKELRTSKGLSQQKLADFLGTSKSSVNMYERGEREPGLEMVENIADFFNVDVDYLFGKSDIPNRDLVQACSIPNIPSPSEINPDMFVLYMYKKLDTEDRAEIRGEMKQMLKADKYSGDAPVPVTYLFSMPFYNIPVSAGTGEFLDSDDYEMLDLVEEPPGGANFIVRVSGDSMEPTYHDGDKLFIKQQPNIEVGEIGIFMIDGSVYVKEFDSDGLISHNDKYDKIKFTEYENIRCYGKVVGKVEE